MLMNEDQFGVPIPNGHPASYILIGLLILAGIYIMIQLFKNYNYNSQKKNKKS